VKIVAIILLRYLGYFNIVAVSSSFLLASSITRYIVVVVILYHTFYNKNYDLKILDTEEKGKKSVTQSILRG
jgi:hypothetical protein